MCVRRVLLLVSFLLIVGSLFSMGISISPGATLTFVRELGDELKLPPLTLINVNENPMEYTIKVTAECRLKGYYSLPDIEWVRLSTENTVIEALDSAEVDIFVTIPDTPENMNRAWGFTISVTQKPLKKEAVGFAAIELGAQAHWFIETKSTPNNLSAALDEPLVVSPSLWTAIIGEDEPTTGELAFSLMNNDDVPHTYTFENYTPYYGDEVRGQVLDIVPLIGGGDSWVSEAAWVKMKKTGFLFFKSDPKVKLGPGESAELLVEVDVPRESLDGSTYESLIYIKVDGNYANGRFVRFIIR